MSIITTRTLALCLVLLVGGVWSLPLRSDEPASEGSVDFVRDIEPIFAERCSSCHGANVQEGQLRLDARAASLKGGVSGSLFVAKKGRESLLYKRVAGMGDEDRMPLDDDPLSDEQIELIRRWIDEGAIWPAGVGVKLTPNAKHWAYVPPVRPAIPPVSPPGWVQSPIDAFVFKRLEEEGLTPSDRADEARLLRRVYLDLIGLPPSLDELDGYLSDDRPNKYQIVVERLLASPRYGERWARPWLDAARYADSNGYQADQYRSVWPYRDWVIRAMNADMSFDQFTREQIAGDLLPDATVDQQIASGFHRLTTCNVEAGVDPEENRVNQIIDRVNTTGTVWLGTTIECAQCHNHKYDPFTQRDYYQLFAYFNNTPLEVEGDGVTFEFVGPKLDLPLPTDQQLQLDELQSELAALKTEAESLAARRLQTLPAWEAQHAMTGTPSDSDVPDAIAQILARPADQRNAKQQRQLEGYFTDLDPDIKKIRDKMAVVQKQIDTLKPITTLVMVEKDESRETAIFKRGSFLDRGQSVSMGTPRVLPELTEGVPGDRRALAAWLTDESNPLTSRAAVNRWWAEFFGRGIVETIEDLGTQGEPPSHPELLDYLAVEFMESGWSMKHVHKLIVMSATYQQSSGVSPELFDKDPYNKFYARGPRFRMPAETIRDNALAISGLLSNRLAGPPVFPPQPNGIWRHVGRNAPKYDTSQGTDRFRRGVYVFWRRSAPYPSFTNFDAPDRASCVVLRPRTNTPLQALTLLNDPAYIEMAVALAERITTEGANISVEDRAAFAFRLCVARQPKTDELKQLVDVFDLERSRFEQSPGEAEAIVGKFAIPNTDINDLAAWVFVANILLNLDETITKG